MSDQVKCGAEARDYKTGVVYRCDFVGTSIAHRTVACFQRIVGGVIWWPNGRPNIKEAR